MVRETARIETQKAASGRSVPTNREGVRRKVILLGIPSEAERGRRKGAGIHKLQTLYTHNPRRGYVANEDDVGVDSGGDDDGGTVDFDRFYAGGRHAGVGGWRWPATAASSTGRQLVITIKPALDWINRESHAGSQQLASSNVRCSAV